MLIGARRESVLGVVPDVPLTALAALLVVALAVRPSFHLFVNAILIGPALIVSGLVCTDAGLNSGVIVSEYGWGDFGAAYGGVRTSWDLSHVDLSINMNTKLSSSDGQSVTCTTSSCPDDQAYSYTTDSAAVRNSALGQTYVHTFCV